MGRHDGEPGARPGQECPAGSDGLEASGEAFPPERITGLIAGARRRSLVRGALVSLVVCTDRVNLPITYGLVGFPAFPGLYCSERDDGSAFLEALGHLARTRGPEQRLFRQAEGYVHEHGLQIFGVVVTGKASDLIQQRGRPWVRAALLGLTANEY